MALWSLFWRMFVLTPVVVIFGTLVLAVVAGLSILPPLLVFLLVLSADYFWAVVTMAVWLAWLKFGGPVRSLVFEGFEHGSL